MKQFISFLMIVWIGLPGLLYGQDDSKYLAGAVPEVDGKVVFSKTYSFPGVAQDAIYERIYPWLESRMKSNENNSRIVYEEKEKGQIVASGEEYLVFTSNALSLDRATINYQVIINCKPEQCQISLERIRYEYQEKEKYTAEEQITDGVALNKDKTKIHRGYKKFREKTVDFADELFDGARVAFGLSKESIVPITEEKAPTPLVAAEPLVAADANQIGTVQPVDKQESKPEIAVVEKTTTPSTPPAPVESAPASASLQGYKLITPDKIPGNIIKMLGEDWMLVTAGNDQQFNMMTASWGGLGRLYEKPTATCFINPTRYTYQLLEKNDTYTLSFYTEAYRDALQYCGTNSGRDTDKVKGSGLTPITTPSGSKAFAEAWLIIECRKLVGQSLNHDGLFDEKVKAEWVGKQLHKMYIGEIINVWVK